MKKATILFSTVILLLQFAQPLSAQESFQASSPPPDSVQTVPVQKAAQARQEKETLESCGKSQNRKSGYTLGRTSKILDVKAQYVGNNPQIGYGFLFV